MYDHSHLRLHCVSSLTPPLDVTNAKISPLIQLLETARKASGLLSAYLAVPHHEVSGLARFKLTWTHLSATLETKFLENATAPPALHGCCTTRTTFFFSPTVKKLTVRSPRLLASCLLGVSHCIASRMTKTDVNNSYNILPLVILPVHLTFSRGIVYFGMS